MAAQSQPDEPVAFPPWARWEFAALLIPVLLFAGLATHKIHAPGLYYDEMFVISPGYGIPAYKTWFGVPILISPYVGAYKSWMYPPIFALFGVSAWSIRLPAILISCGTLIGGYALVRRVLNRRWALVFSIACAVHPGFIFLTKVDWGPEVIMLFLKALCLLVCFRWLDGTRKSCWFVLGLWVLGFWDKFNFIWFIIALVIGTCTVYGDVVLQKLRRVRPIILVGAGVGLIGGGLLTLRIIFPLLEKPQTSALSKRLLQIWNLYRSTCTGLSTAYMWFKSVPSLPTWTGWSVAALTIAFLIFALVGHAESKTHIRATDRRTLRFCLWCSVMFGIIFLEIALTPQAGGAHHTIMLFPFDLLACFSAAYLFANSTFGKTRGVILLLLGGIACFWTASNLEALEIQFTSFKNVADFQARFSPRIETLARFLDRKGADADAIFCIEWGVGNQLRALCKPAIARKVKDEWPTFQTWSPKQQNARAIADWIFPPRGKVLYVCFSEREAVFLPAQKHFAQMSTFAKKPVYPAKDLPPALAKTYQLFQDYPPQ